MVGTDKLGLGAVIGAFAQAAASNTTSGTIKIPIDNMARKLITPSNPTTIHANTPASRCPCPRRHMTDTHTSPTDNRGRARTNSTRTPLTATIVALDDECVVTPSEEVAEEVEE